MTIVNSKCFTIKDKLITYTEVFIKLYNQRNLKQIYEIYKIVKLEKQYTFILKNAYNFSAY